MPTNRTTHYEYLIKEFGKEKLSDRYIYLQEAAQSFIKSRDIHDIVCVSDAAMNNIVIDYFADIDRLKKFHNIERVNSNKVAAYTACGQG